MSQLSYAWEQAPVEDSVAPPAIPWVEPIQRSILQPILLVAPLLLAVGGYAFASPQLADLSFLLLAALCIIFLFGDLRRFSERYGLGGIVLYGGILTWFCDDYFRNWFLGWFPSWHLPFTRQVVAKAVACHMLYIFCMSIGIRSRFGRWLPKFFTSLPEPRKPSDYFWIVILTQIIGLSPYFIFTHEPFYMALYHGVVSARGSAAGNVAWTVGRTGNLNYNWGGYVAQMLEVGTGGGVLAAFCIVFLRQGVWKNVVCALAWATWLAFGFGSGTRGEIVALVLPLVCFVFIRYHVQAQEFLRRFSIRAYVIVLILLMFSWVLMAIQTRYRNIGFNDVKLSELSLSKVEGNQAFSFGLIGFSYIPERHNYFYNNFPGEMIVMPIPNFLFWLAVAPMPRALWTTKPIDPFWMWYNAVFTGRSTLGGGTTEGTTIACGSVGDWFFRFGIAGLIEGGLFVGWLIGCAERAMFNNRGRTMAVLLPLAILDWIYRCFRSFGMSGAATILVIMLGIELCIFVLRPFTKPAPSYLEHGDA
jgi:hypothetical protein